MLLQREEITDPILRYRTVAIWAWFCFDLVSFVCKVLLQVK